jgi:hypothetical protein
VENPVGDRIETDDHAAHLRQAGDEFLFGHYTAEWIQNEFTAGLAKQIQRARIIPGKGSRGDNDLVRHRFDHFLIQAPESMPNRIRKAPQVYGQRLSTFGGRFGPFSPCRRQQGKEGLNNRSLTDSPFR